MSTVTPESKKLTSRLGLPVLFPSRAVTVPSSVSVMVPTRHFGGGGAPIDITPDMPELTVSVGSMRASLKTTSSGTVPPGASRSPTWNIALENASGAHDETLLGAESSVIFPLNRTDPVPAPATVQWSASSSRWMDLSFPDPISIQVGTDVPPTEQALRTTPRGRAAGGAPPILLAWATNAATSDCRLPSPAEMIGT